MCKKRKLNNGEYLKINIVELEDTPKLDITEKEKGNPSYSVDPLLLACAKGIENQNTILMKIEN